VIDGIQIALLEKVDRSTTEMIVHQKYEDIVHYLQDALQANAEDEENFKNIAKSLQESVDKIMLAKVDRAEIRPMQEAIAHTEAVVHKLKNSTSDSKAARDQYSRAEVDKLLGLKMDKAEFDEKIAELTKAKKGKRFSVTQLQEMTRPAGESTSPQMMDDSIVSADGNLMVGNMRQIPSMKQKVALTAPDKFDGAKWSGLTGGGGGGAPGRGATSGFPVNAPGSFRLNSESGQPGGLPVMQHSQSAEGFRDAPHVRDTSFLGAATMGGGFNTHSKGMLRAPDMVAPNPRDLPDLEGENL
jgi:hypothetical protein